MRIARVDGKWNIELTPVDLARELVRQHRAYGCASLPVACLIADCIRRRYPKRAFAQVWWSDEDPPPPALWSRRGRPRAATKGLSPFRFRAEERRKLRDLLDRRFFFQHMLLDGYRLWLIPSRADIPDTPDTLALCDAGPLLSD